MRFVFDTSVLIAYLRDDRPGDQEVAADALAIASRRGKVLVSMISLMELYLPQRKGLDEEACINNADEAILKEHKSRTKSKRELEYELRRIQALCKSYSVSFISCSNRAQERALEILKHYRSPLGGNALTDSLIIGSGLAWQAYLVTTDKKWSDIAKENQDRSLPLPSIRIISPTELVQRF